MKLNTRLLNDTIWQKKRLHNDNFLRQLSENQGKEPFPKPKGKSKINKLRFKLSIPSLNDLKKIKLKRIDFFKMRYKEMLIA